jgi:hypothetical protein
VLKPGLNPDQLKAMEAERAKLREAIERKAQADKELILAETSLVTSQTKQKEEELKLKQTGLENERVEREKLKAKLSSIENKLLHGTQILDEAKKKARDLQEKERILEHAQVLDVSQFNTALWD